MAGLRCASPSAPASTSARTSSSEALGGERKIAARPGRGHSRFAGPHAIAQVGAAGRSRGRRDPATLHPAVREFDPRLRAIAARIRPHPLEARRNPRGFLQPPAMAAGDPEPGHEAGGESGEIPSAGGNLAGGDRAAGRFRNPLSAGARQGGMCFQRASPPRSEKCGRAFEDSVTNQRGGLNLSGSFQRETC